MWVSVLTRTHGGGHALRRERGARNIPTLCENVHPGVYMRVRPSPSKDLDGMEAMGTRPDRWKGRTVSVYEVSSGARRLTLLRQGGKEDMRVGL